MKFSQLTESRMDHFPEVVNLQFDPDRTDIFDIVHGLMPLIVKMSYCNMMDDKARHDKNAPLDEKDREEEGFKDFEMTTSTLRDSVDDVIRLLRERLDEVSTSDVQRAIKLEKSKFKVPLQD